MTSRERITVAETTSGKGSDGTVGRDVSLPVDEVLTGRGFVTGKSGSGKSNSAGVIAEELLEQGFGLLIVDVDGEYYGLKEEYEVLHCGADEKCDVQVSADHGVRLAALAIERNVPIVLDVSGFIDEAATTASASASSMNPETSRTIGTLRSIASAARRSPWSAETWTSHFSSAPQWRTSYCSFSP